jgi:hypothetical protein
MYAPPSPSVTIRQAVLGMEDTCALYRGLRVVACRWNLKSIVIFAVRRAFKDLLPNLGHSVIVG